jgi:ribonuclease H / adenosylcobalamin/alpha-ribazole phosphatase
VTKGVRKAGKTVKDAERRRLARRTRESRDVPEARPLPPGWAVLRCDGGSRGNPGPAAYGFVLEADDGGVLASGAGAIGVATVATAEYRAVAEGLEAAVGLGLRGIEEGLEAAVGLGLRGIEVRTDSRLVVGHLAERGRALRSPGLDALRDRALAAADRVGSVTYRWVPAAENAAADALVRDLLV